MHFLLHYILSWVLSSVGQFECICVLVLRVGSVQPNTSWQHCGAGEEVVSIVSILVWWICSEFNWLFAAKLLFLTNLSWLICGTALSVTTCYYIMPRWCNLFYKFYPSTYKFIWTTYFCFCFMLRLEDAGYAVGARVLELLCHREKVWYQFFFFFGLHYIL